MKLPSQFAISELTEGLIFSDGIQFVPTIRQKKNQAAAKEKEKQSAAK